MIVPQNQFLRRARKRIALGKIMRRDHAKRIMKVWLREELKKREGESYFEQIFIGDWIEPLTEFETKTDEFEVFHPMDESACIYPEDELPFRIPLACWDNDPVLAEGYRKMIKNSEYRLSKNMKKRAQNLYINVVCLSNDRKRVLVGLVCFSSKWFFV